MCSHEPPCPPVTDGTDRPLGVLLAARIVAVRQKRTPAATRPAQSVAIAA